MEIEIQKLVLDRCHENLDFMRYLNSQIRISIKLKNSEIKFQPFQSILKKKLIEHLKTVHDKERQYLYQQDSTVFKLLNVCSDQAFLRSLIECFDNNKFDYNSCLLFFYLVLTNKNKFFVLIYLKFYFQILIFKSQLILCHQLIVYFKPSLTPSTLEMSSQNHNNSKSQRENVFSAPFDKDAKIPEYDGHRAHPVKLQSFNGNLEEAVNFYIKQVNKLFFANVVLNSQLKTVIEEKKKLADILASQQQNKNSAQDRKKRHRRSAADIDRNYRCPVQKCGKCYGSEGSLSQHIKLKHPGFNYDQANEGGNDPV